MRRFDTDCGRVINPAKEVNKNPIAYFSHQLKVGFFVPI